MKNIRFNVNKLLPILLIIFIIFFYYNSRVNHIKNININSKNTISTIEEISLTTLNVFFNNDITDEFINQNLYNSFSKESLDMYKEINITLKNAKLTAKFSVDKINDFDSYIVDNKRCYYFNANIKAIIYNEDGKIISNENKNLESYIIEDSTEEKIFKILKLTLKGV